MNEADESMLNLWLSLPKAYPDVVATREEALAVARKTGQDGFYSGVLQGKRMYFTNLAAVMEHGAVEVVEEDV